jgi:hypothetical protein
VLWSVIHPSSTNDSEQSLAYRTHTPITVDGHLDEEAWALAPRSPRFVDVVGANPALYETRAAVVWVALLLALTYACNAC